MVDSVAVGEAIALVSLRLGHMDADLLDDGTPFEIVHHHVGELVLIFPVRDDRPADPHDEGIQKCLSLAGG